MILRAGWVLPIGAPPIRDGRVAVLDGRIVAVGASGDSTIPEGATMELGPGILMPGLVNAHCHLELSYLLGRLPRAGGYVPWIEAVVGARGTAAEADVAAATGAAITVVKEAGTVAVADVSNTLAHVSALRDSGLRALVLYELLGWDPAAAESILAAAVARLGAIRGGPRLTLRLAAHAPHSVSPRLLALLVKHGGPAAIHLAESRDEVAFLREGGGEWGEFLDRRRLGHVSFVPPRMSPVAYADAAGALHGDLIAAHCVQTGTADHALLARRGVHVALCPRSNANLGVGVPPLPDLLSAGVNVCVGTDSLASVDSLDVLDDVVTLHRAFPGVAAGTLLEMATRNGARALGMQDLGTIARGMAAALAYVEADEEIADPEAFIVSGDARLRPVAA
jgi:cytosine/adenosine deaminase-related metal-dependent hydrolase